jgi:2,5-diketo-D-gluconate reductase A
MFLTKSTGNQSRMSTFSQPVVGLGTLGLKESAEAAVRSATDQGYTLIDTGEHYGNLALVGAALKSLSADAKLPHVIVKLSGMPVGDYEKVKVRMTTMLTLLGLERCSLCLMHWPGVCDWDPTDMRPLASPTDFQGKASSWEDFCASIKSAWENMQRLQKEGLCEEIGTSNFYAHHLEEIAKVCDGASPFANEVFIDITNPEEDLVTQMQQKGIRVLAYRPVAYQPHPDSVKAIAARLGVSTHAVILAWLLRRGIFPLVKCRSSHVADNRTIPEEIKGKLTADDMQELQKCAVDMRYSAEWFAKLWKAQHHTTSACTTEEDVQMLLGMGVEEAKARFVLHECGGDLDRAMDMAFS